MQQAVGSHRLGAEYGLRTRAIVRLTPNQAAIAETAKMIKPEMAKLSREIEEARAELDLRLLKERHAREITADRIDTYRELIAAGDASRLAAQMANDPEDVATVLAIMREEELAGRRDAIELIHRMVDSGVIERPEIGDQVKEAIGWLQQATARVVPDAEPQQKIDSARWQGTESVQGRPPSQPVDYDELVRSAFAELVQPGRLLFNPPDRMELGQTARVEVRLTRTLELDVQLLEHLRGSGKPQVEEISTAPLMAVTLQGDGFDIRAYSDEEQRVTPDEITTWEFDIRALKRGQQRLILCVSLRIPVPGHPLEHKSIPVREVTIEVQVGTVVLVANFVSANWQWFIGTAIAIGAVIVAILFH
jgi:hypothetical protein